MKRRTFFKSCVAAMVSIVPGVGVLKQTKVVQSRMIFGGCRSGKTEAQALGLPRLHIFKTCMMDGMTDTTHKRNPVNYYGTCDQWIA